MFITSLAVFSLTGCMIFQRPADMDIAILDGEGGVEIAVCRDFRPAIGILQQRTHNGEWETLADAPLERTLAAGETIKLASLFEGPRGFVEPRMNSGDEIALVLTADDGGILGDFLIPESGMRKDLWLRSDGSFKAGPCD